MLAKSKLLFLKACSYLLKKTDERLNKQKIVTVLLILELYNNFSELFNLPVPALWTAVLGEWDRAEQKGSYVPIERIVLHHRFHNYQHDIGQFDKSLEDDGENFKIELLFCPLNITSQDINFCITALMKMTKPADVSPGSKIRTICLPPFEPPITNYNLEKGSAFYMRPENSEPHKRKAAKPPKPNPDTATKYLEKLGNLTKSIFSGFTNKKHKNMRYNVRVANDSNRQPDRKDEELHRSEGDRKSDLVYDSATLDSVVKLIKNQLAKDVRVNVNDRSDKKLMFGEEIDPFIDDNNGLDFKDECYATGWGREQTNGTLTDVLLEAEVPILPLKLCRDRYSLTLPLNEGHLCAGSTDGSTGACVVSIVLFHMNCLAFVVNISSESEG